MDTEKKLTSMQLKVTQENGTEPAFNNEYWDSHKPGIFFDNVSGEPGSASLIHMTLEQAGRVLPSRLNPEVLWRRGTAIGS